MSNSDQPVKVAVTFKGAKNGIGLTKYAGRLNSKMIEDFIPDPNDIALGIQRLEEKGFVVSSQNDLLITVRGKKVDYEKSFKTELTPHSIKPYIEYEGLIPFLYPLDTTWEADPLIDEVIDSAYIQWPSIYTDRPSSENEPSKNPPNIASYHLRVPSDVARILNATEVHSQGVTGKGIRVAMIDSGFYFNHPYFQESSYNTDVTLAAGATQLQHDGDGHGTAMAANLLAVSPGVDFIGIKLTNEENDELSATLLEGINEALKHEPDIISISLSSDLVRTVRGSRVGNVHRTTLPCSLKALEGTLLMAINEGITVVCASGNGEVGFPAMMPEVIGAGGVYVDEDGRMEASNYASAFESKIYIGRNVPDFCGLTGMAENYGKYILLPLQVGSRLDRLIDPTSGRDGWGLLSGTSSATAQIAGVCALLLEKNGSLSPEDLKSVIKSNCKDVIHGSSNPASNQGVALLAGLGEDVATGSGLVDAFAAFNQV
ncbi:MAG: S8 family serine peptidase [Cyclobacteriaceae bacterium]